MTVNFKVIALRQYAGVGNAIGRPYDEYLAEKTAAELDLYGVAGGAYYLPVFEITFPNGVTATYQNAYKGEIIDEIKPDGLALMMADGDSLDYFRPHLVSLDAGMSVARELDPKCLNSDFARYYDRAAKGDGAVLSNLGEQAAFAAGLRDCEAYMLPTIG